MRDRQRRPREDPEGRGVLYLAGDLATALAEAYSGQWPQVAICERARAAWVRPTAPANLLDLSHEGALRAPGGDRRLWAGWHCVRRALAGQRRQPRRIAAVDCPTCRRQGHAG